MKRSTVASGPACSLYPLEATNRLRLSHDKDGTLGLLLAMAVFVSAEPKSGGGVQRVPRIVAGAEKRKYHEATSSEGFAAASQIDFF